MTEYAELLREVLIGRQPILDRNQQLVGYQLLFRSAEAQTSAEDGTPPDASGDGLHATAKVVNAAFAELGLQSALGQHKAHINAPEDFILDDVVELLPAGSVVLGLDFSAPPDEKLLARCHTLRDRGYSFSLPHYTGLNPKNTVLLPLVSVVRIDIQTAGSQLADLAGGLKRLPLKLLAEKVETQAEMERCNEIGFDLFQGYHFARPTIVSGRQLSSSQLGIIRLINLVARDADTPQLEDNFKREPGLTVNLLRLVNAVGMGLGRKIDSLRHAVTVLGRKQLLRWLQLLLMASPNSGSNPERNPLLQLAALRGRLMESLTLRRYANNRGLADQAFLTGIMSLMPAALGIAMPKILEQITVSSDVQDALLGHEGQLGRLLALIEAFDANDSTACDLLLAEIGSLSRDTLTEILAEGLAWLHSETEALA